MALDEQLAAKPQAPEVNANDLTDEEEKDLEIGVLMGERMLEDGGFDVIQRALDDSSDPAQVIGQFFIQLITQFNEQFPEDMKLSPRIYLAKGGWLEQLMDMVIDELGVDVKTADKAEIYVAQMAQELAAGNAQQQQAEQQQAAAGPAMPVQGGM